MTPIVKHFFGGRVEIKSLPVTDQPASRTEVQARLFSPKGELAVLAEGALEIRHLAYVELRAAMPRGDHYHQLRHEHFYLIEGEITLHLQDIDTHERASAVLTSGDLIQIQPRIAHTLVPARAGHALEFAAQPFDLGDVYRHPLLPG